MIEIEIKSLNGELLWAGEVESCRDAILAAIASGVSLAGANLWNEDLAGVSLAGADLRGVNLTGANLAGADLTRADLTRAVLTRAVLADANLAGVSLADAFLGDIREDVEDVLSPAHAEVPGVLAALREGRVDGSAYSGKCACLVGTIANLRNEIYDNLSIDLQPDSYRPAERWFLGIRPGDTPENSQIVAITVEWIEQWLRDRGVADGHDCR